MEVCLYSKMEWEERIVSEITYWARVLGSQKCCWLVGFITKITAMQRAGGNKLLLSPILRNHKRFHCAECNFPRRCSFNPKWFFVSCSVAVNNSGRKPNGVDSICIEQDKISLLQRERMGIKSFLEHLYIHTSVHRARSTTAPP